jgi:DNA-binding SARP family transcriptional activator/tetratricopeptide (TPR) repeat protein
MDFRILGPLEVDAETGPLSLGGGKQRALLAVLLLSANEIVSSDRLIEALWEDDPPESPHNALQVHVSQLRKALGRSRLQTQAPGYRLHVDADEFDLARFLRLRGEGKLDEALSLWRGAPLAEFGFDRFAQTDIARLEELRLGCVEERIERDLARGRHCELVAEVAALVKLHPLRERMRAQLMLCLYRSGRQVEALDVYTDCRRALVDELGVEPGRELRELHEAILQQDRGLDFKPTAEVGATAFVGRERELGELLAGLDEASAGHGRLFLLAGEPGIGKSRLAEELVDRARARGAVTLIGRCWEASGAPAYWPWVQSLRAYVRTSDSAVLSTQLGAGAIDLAQILPEIRNRFPDLEDPLPFEADRARFHLFDATAEFLRRAAESEPIVLVLDDLHAADAPSLLFLQFLARELGSIRLLILAAYRDVDPTVGGPLADMLAEVARESHTRRIALAGLSEAATAAYVEAAAPLIATPELIATVHEETEGNPLFVGEIVRLLALERAPANGTPAVRPAIPDTVREVIARRLARLSPECNRVLVLASIIGREFSLDALALVTEVAPRQLIETLDEAVAARVVSDSTGVPDRLRFEHVLIRDTLYDSVTAGRRIGLHRLVFDRLEGFYVNETGPRCAELAYHAVGGRDYEKGVEYAQSAGDRALRLLAYEESARQYEVALAALDRCAEADESSRCELLLSLGEAHGKAGDTPAAKDAFIEAAEIAQHLGLTHELARAAAGYGGRSLSARAGNDERLVPLLEAGLVAVGEQDIELRARLLARLAGALRGERSRERRDTLSAEAVAFARRSGNPRALALALDGRTVAMFGPDTHRECLALATEQCEIARQIDDKERRVHGHLHRLIAELALADVRAAEVDLEAMCRNADDLRQAVQLWFVCALRAMMALGAGRLTDAAELIPEALALGERAQGESAVPTYVIQQAALDEFRGELGDAHVGIRELVVQYPARPVFACALAHLDARAGRSAEARQTLARFTCGDGVELPFDGEWLHGMSLLAEVCAILGDARSAAVLYRLLLPWQALNVSNPTESLRGAVARYLGLLATTQERWADAASHFELALEMNEQMGARPWLAYTHDDYASMLLARADARDAERAAELHAAAVRTYVELGMTASALHA